MEYWMQLRSESSRILAFEEYMRNEEVMHRFPEVKHQFVSQKYFGRLRSRDPVTSYAKTLIETHEVSAFRRHNPGPENINQWMISEAADRSKRHARRLAQRQCEEDETVTDVIERHGRVVHLPPITESNVLVARPKTQQPSSSTSGTDEHKQMSMPTISSSKPLSRKASAAGRGRSASRRHGQGSEKTVSFTHFGPAPPKTTEQVIRDEILSRPPTVPPSSMAEVIDNEDCKVIPLPGKGDFRHGTASKFWKAPPADEA